MDQWKQRCRWKGRLVACRSGGRRRAPGKDEVPLPPASGEVNEGRRRGLAGRTTRAVDARFGGWSAVAGLRGGRWAPPPPEGTPNRRRRARQNPSAAGVGQEREEARVGSESDRGVGGKEKRRGTPISGGIAGNFYETSTLTAGKSTSRVAVENELQKSCFCGSRGLEAHPFGLAFDFS